jgi:hypothetical protein
MKITGHKTSSMFKRYADLFSDEEKRTQQRAVREQAPRIEKGTRGQCGRYAQAGSNPIERAHNAHT